MTQRHCFLYTIHKNCFTQYDLVTDAELLYKSFSIDVQFFLLQVLDLGVRKTALSLLWPGKECSVKFIT